MFSVRRDGDYTEALPPRGRDRDGATTRILLHCAGWTRIVSTQRFPAKHRYHAITLRLLAEAIDRTTANPSLDFSSPTDVLLSGRAYD